MSYLDTLSDEQVADMRDHFYSLGWGQNETMWKCWCQALDYIAPQLSATQQKLEAAEACIKASQEQEPVKVLYQKEYGSDEWHENQFYLKPAIPPDVAELQRENAELIRRDSEQIDRIAELTRTLGEYQAVWSKVFRMQYNCCSAQQMADFMGEYCQSTEWDGKELTKLLAEAKSTAVPEGWQLVPKEPTEGMPDSLFKDALKLCETEECYESPFKKNIRLDYKAMLAAAPQPETDRG